MNKINPSLAACRPFEIAVPDETLADIRARVAAFPWHEMPDDGGWDYGTNLDYMKELCAYWLEAYDWRRHEAALNRFSQSPLKRKHASRTAHQALSFVSAEGWD